MIRVSILCFVLLLGNGTTSLVKAAEGECAGNYSTKRAKVYKFDGGGLQSVLRDSANELAKETIPGSNPVRYIDFANDAKFSIALGNMNSIGFPIDAVQMYWLVALKEAYRDKVANLNLMPDDVGPDQTLSGLITRLGMQKTW